MKKCFLLLPLLLNSATLLLAQVDTIAPSVIKKMGFKEYRVMADKDTVFFYVHQKKEKPANLVVFLSGSTPDPLFSYEWKDGKLQSYYWGHWDHRSLPDDYCFVTIAKKGMEGVWDEAVLNDRPTPAAYLAKNSLDYRVWQANKAIDYCYKNILKDPRKVIVYGHSEGFNVVAKLVTRNKKITHAGLWAGSAMPDYFDFMMFRRKDYLQGKISDTTACREIDTLLSAYKKVFDAPGDIQSTGIYTNKRWSSYAEPPINYLKDVKIPLYMMVASKDDNAPVESSYIVPLEFIRLGKTNLTYRTCIGCDHSFNVTDAAGKKTSLWDKIFADFIKWTEE